MIRVLGLGWVQGGEFGCARLGRRHAFPAGATLHSLWRAAALLPAPPKNVGRFDAATHLACDAIALALRDAGLESAAGRTQDIGLLVATPDGSVAANRAYFADYLAGGRTLGRGNLFIYTLPTSAAAEAAICFGLRGPLLYAAAARRPAHGLLSMAGGMLGSGESSLMLALLADGATAVCFLLAPETIAPHHGVCDLEEVLRIAEKEMTADALIGAVAERRTGAPA